MHLLRTHGKRLRCCFCCPLGRSAPRCTALSIERFAARIHHRSAQLRMKSEQRHQAHTRNRADTARTMSERDCAGTSPLHRACTTNRSSRHTSQLCTRPRRRNQRGTRAPACSRRTAIGQWWADASRVRIAAPWERPLRSLCPLGTRRMPSCRIPADAYRRGTMSTSRCRSFVQSCQAGSLCSWRRCWSLESGWPCRAGRRGRMRCSRFQ